MCSINFFADLSSSIFSQSYLAPNDTLKFLSTSEYYKAKRCGKKIYYALTVDQDKRSDDEIREKRKLPLRQFAKALHNHLPTDEEIKSAILELKKKIMILQYRLPNGKYSYFEGQQKGTERYNKKMEALIKDTLTAFSCADRETVALTLTCDPKNENGDRYNCWERYTKDISKTLEHYRKHGNALFIWIKESTKNGYPHAHCVLSFPKGTIKGYDAMKNRQKITYGKFYKAIKKSVVSPVFDLEKVSGKNLKYYLSKYVSKGTTQDFFKMGEKNYSFSDSDRKLALCTLATICTGSRQMGKTQNRKILNTIPDIPEETKRGLGAEELKEKLCPPQKDDLKKETYDWKSAVGRICNPLYDDEEIKDDCHRLRRYLIEICNNSPFSCCLSLRAMSVSRYEEEKFNEYPDLENEKKEVHERFKEKSANLGCSGCYFSHLSNLILTGIDQYFDFFEYDENGIPHELFNKTVYKDDVLFMKSFVKAVNFYMQSVNKGFMEFRQTKEMTFINKKPSETGVPNSARSEYIKNFAAYAAGNITEEQFNNTNKSNLYARYLQKENEKK